MTISYLERKTCLPVTVQDFRWIVSGAVELKDVRLYIPPDQVGTWKNRVIVHVGFIFVKFDTMSLLYDVILLLLFLNILYKIFMF
jgi:hypothetical protein